MKVKNGKVKAFGILRDRKGRPKLDDWYNIPDEISVGLTDEDWDYIAMKRQELENNPIGD